MVTSKTGIFLSGVILLMAVGIIGISFRSQENKLDTNDLEATVLTKNGSEVTLQDDKNIIYTFQTDDVDVDVGANVLLKYTGLLDKNTQIQNNTVVDLQTTVGETDENGIPLEWKDNGIFHHYYILAYQKLKKLSLVEKIGQLLLVRYPDDNAIDLLKKYKFGGFVFFEKDFRNKTEKEVQTMIKGLQNTSSIPLLTAVDEEGGTIVRISSNSNLVASKFKAPRELYLSGGFQAITQDTINKSKILKKLGINLNLAPVVDVSTNTNDYMYSRTLGEDTTLTSTYAKTVIQASFNTGVSYTLKHFPGYGNNADTHIGSVSDNRSYHDIVTNDLPPFKSGIDVGAEAVLVSHNIVTSIDSNYPASLSPSVHNLLRNDLDFTGIIITDDLSMGALSSIHQATVKALLAGNDLIITTDYENSINEIQTALDNGTISESFIDKLAFRVLAWKYYKGLMLDTK